jgi:hypothetical protein
MTWNFQKVEKPILLTAPSNVLRAEGGKLVEALGSDWNKAISAGQQTTYRSR